MICNGRKLQSQQQTCAHFLFRALEASLLTSGLSETDIENIRKQNIEPLGLSVTTQDLSTVMELSKRDEEARLNRLREEEEELEKVGVEIACVRACLLVETLSFQGQHLLSIIDRL